MKALISASNELPEKDQGLEALWDRFLVRLVVEGITDEEKFNEMIAMPSTPFNEKVDGSITDGEYKDWSKKIDQIGIPENVFNVIQVIREKIDLYNNEDDNKEKPENKIYVSDRRWRKIVRLMRTSAFLNDRKEIDLMDCFLIKHCIWNEEEQKDTVWQFVSDAVEEYGYTKDIDFTSISEELVSLQTEIDEETKFVKDTRVKVLKPVRTDYYQILNPPQPNIDLIMQNDYKKLTNANQNINLSYWDNSYQQIRRYDDYYNRFNARKGNSKFSIFINDKEYSLKQMTQGDKRQTTKKPNDYTEKAWDERVDGFLQQTGNMKNVIEQYQNKDLQHLRTNLFVEPKFANIVESHITATQKVIDIIELGIREIQNGYKKLKDEEVVLND